MPPLASLHSLAPGRDDRSRRSPADYLTCRLGYILHPSYQRQGYGSEAVAALVRQALTAGGMH